MTTQFGKLSIAELINILQDNPDNWSRAEAASSLGVSDDPLAVEPLITALKDKNYYVRQLAVEGLGFLGDARAIEPLIEALKDEDPRVAQEVPQSLGYIGVPALEAVIRLLQSNTHDPKINDWAIRALSFIGGAKALEIISSIQQNKDEKLPESK